MSETRFLNVDLELESTSDLSPLTRRLGDQVCVLFSGWSGELYHLALEVSIETPPPSNGLDADARVRDFIGLISQLPPALRALWDGCRSRVFDIGFDAGTSPWPFRQTIAEATAQAISSVGAALRITIYPYTPEPGKGA